MWRQINNVLGHLSPITYGSKKKKWSEDPGSSGLELSVRPAVGRPGTELRSLSKASEHTAVPETAADRRLGTSEHVQHPLQNGTGRLEPLSGQSAQTATADSNSQQEHPKAQHASSQAPSNAGKSVEDARDSLLQQVLSISWISQAPDAARLVLSLCCELAASSLQDQKSQEQLVNTLELVAAASSWQAACALCKHMLLLRALVAHYLPGAAASAADDNWQQLQEQYLMQNRGKPSMSAQFISQAVAAAETCESTRSTTSSSSSSGEGSSDIQQCMQLLASCIVYGEAVQFQREQQASWQCLQQLSTAAQPHSNSSDHGQLDLPLLLQTWAAAVAAAVDASQQPQQQPQQQSQDRAQLLPVQWDLLLGALHHLQQQVQEVVAGDQQQRQQKQESEQSDSWQGPDGAGAAASDSASDLEAAGSSVPSAAGQGLDAQPQQPQQQLDLLQELCKTAPMLLQPADLAHMQAAAEGTAAAPNSMGLVVLLRLAASTSSLWLPLLVRSRSRSSSSSSKVEISGNVAADAAASPDSAPVGTKLQLHPVLSSRLDAEVAAIWQDPAAEQASTESQAAQGAAAAGMPSSKGIAPSLRSPRSSWPDELLSTAQLWPGDVESEDDAAAITREERTLRCWINSVLHQGTNALSAAAAATAAPDLQGRLSHTHSVDSGLTPGRVQAQGSEGAAAGVAGPLRTQSMGGGSVDGAQQCPGPLQLPAGATPGGISGASSSGVFRSGSAGAAAVAAHLDGSGAGSSVTHARSISADAPGAAADLSFDGWGGEPAAPTTPTTAAAAAAAGAGPFAPLHAGAGSRSSAVVVPSISSVSSLFGAELRSGVLLLEILELLQPGCVDWRLANRPPFVSRTAQLKALENCQLALKIAQEELGLPLVSMSPRDIVLGRRKIILSLVYQLMRFNTMQLLESISVAHSEQQAGSHSRRSSATGGSEPSTPKAAAAASTDADKQCPGQQQLPPSGLHFARQSGRVNIRSSSRKQRRQVAITEQDILEWANSKLQQVRPLASSDAATVAEVPVVRSFKDPVLSSGVVLLQLLHVLAPDLVDLSFVTPGRTAEQRQSNARYALSLADKMGCSLFLVWEDLVDPPQPRMVLVLLASLMYQDLKRQQGALV